MEIAVDLYKTNGNNLTDSTRDKFWLLREVRDYSQSQLFAVDSVLLNGFAPLAPLHQDRTWSLCERIAYMSNQQSQRDLMMPKRNFSLI